MLTPQQVLACLRRDSRNHITESWRWMGDLTDVASGSGIYEMSLNEIAPYYAGWSTLLEYQYHIIHPVTLKAIMDQLDKEPWGDGALGGVVYRLKEGYSS